MSLPCANQFAARRGVYGYITKPVGQEDREFFLYWVPDECRLGVYDGDDGHCYETVLDRRARRELLRNIAESLVDSRWAAVLQSEALKVSRNSKDVEGDVLTVGYVTKSIQLKRVGPKSMMDMLRVAWAKETAPLSSASGGGPTMVAAPIDATQQPSSFSWQSHQSQSQGQQFGVGAAVAAVQKYNNQSPQPQTRLFTLKRKHYNEYGVGRRQAGAPTGYHFGGDDGEDEDGNEDGSNTGERVEVKKEEGEEVGGGGEDEQECATAEDDSGEVVKNKKRKKASSSTTSSSSLFR